MQQNEAEAAHSRRASCLNKLMNNTDDLLAEDTKGMTDPLRKQQVTSLSGGSADSERVLSHRAAEYSSLPHHTGPLPSKEVKPPSSSDIPDMEVLQAPRVPSTPPIHNKKYLDIIHSRPRREVRIRSPSSSTSSMSARTRDPGQVDLAKVELEVSSSDGLQPYRNATFLTLFSEKEDARDVVFQAMMKSHCSRLLALESERSYAADSRTREVDQSMKIFDAQFSASQKDFLGRFEREGHARGEVEECRTRMFQAAHNIHDTQFGQRLSWYSKQLRSIVEAEEDSAASLESKVAYLLATMDNSVQNVRREQNTFYEPNSPVYRSGNTVIDELGESPTALSELDVWKLKMSHIQVTKEDVRITDDLISTAVTVILVQALIIALTPISSQNAFS